MANRDVSPAQITQCLGGINFPCSKSQLVQFAQNQNCSSDVLSLLRNLPEKQYNSMNDVMSGVGEVE